MKNHLGEAGVMVYDLYKTLSLLKPKLVSKSSACTFYENSIMKGEIVNYAGLKFSLQNPISQSLRTGEQGSRPGEQGSRPGEQGSRPGEQGSRPGLPVHPCMALHEQF